MTRETVYAKASRYLIEGRLIVRRLDEHERSVVADVRGSGAVYRVVRDRGGWRCNCPAFTPRCVHVECVCRVTALDRSSPVAVAS